MRSKFRRSALAVALCLAQTALAGPAAGFAEIVGLTGRGEMRAEGESAWREAKLNMSLRPADWVRTQEASTMALVVDQTQVRLAANSIFQVRRDDKPTGTTLNLRQGRAWSQTKAPPASVRMQTPSAIAAIHGTDWTMEVDETGRSLLTVVHGEVRLSNEQGEVRVSSGEQAEVLPGQAPVKRRISNPAERVQWVSSFRVWPDRYPEFRADGERGALGDLARQGQWSTVQWALAKFPTPIAADWLLLADLAIERGEFNVARIKLEEGGRKWPEDARFPAALAALTLHLGEGERALELARAAVARFPDAVPAQLTLGEAARFQGLAGEAAAAFGRALQLDAHSAEAHLGLGRVALAADDIERARSHLSVAARQLPEAVAELGAVEAAAGRFAAARAHFDAALQADGQDYLAQAGLARLHLLQSEDEAALAALLRASVLEPRLAQAYVWRAVVHHRRGESAVALDFLHQASERDARDPLPHFIASLILQDIGQPLAAVREARQARAKLPFLKSLAPLSVDQKGRANLGSALASLDLADWALHYASTSFDPLWAGSHFFLADRLVGQRVRNAALMQGYLTDPLAFGADQARQSLLPAPGTYLSLAARWQRSNSDRTFDPALRANGLTQFGEDRLAWFVEALRNVQTHRSEPHVEASGNALTAALGFKPRHDLGFFVFANQYRPDIVERAATLDQRIDGESRRLDAGGSLKLGPERQWWFKAGTGEDRLHQLRASGTRLDRSERQHDLQLRSTWRAAGDELSFGGEWASSDVDVRIGRGRIVLPRTQRDDAFAFWLQGRRPLGESGGSAEGRLTASDYCMEANASGLVTRDCAGARLLPALGLVWSVGEALTLRLRAAEEQRSPAPNGLRPVLLAGIADDEQLLLPGGRQQRLRLQADWQGSERLFVAAFVDQRAVRNLGEAGNVRNAGEEVADIARLRTASLWQYWGQVERLEDQAVFLEGRARFAGVSANALLGDGLAGSAAYVHTVSRNTGTWFRDFPLPYLPRHRASLGLNWSNENRLQLGSWLIWRSARFAAEHGEPLPASWDLALKAQWESADKRRRFDAWAMNLLRKNAAGQRDDARVGIGFEWRYW